MTIQDVKKEITAEFMADEAMAAVYGFERGADFDATFSKASVESILFYDAAACNYYTRRAVATNRAEVEALIAATHPHTVRWYVAKTKAYRHGRPLAADGDWYDLAGVADLDSIAGELVVRHCSATERGGRLYVKVAKGEVPEKLDGAEKAGLEAYLTEVKDAGVVIGPTSGRVTVVSDDADHFAVDLDVWYDPMVLSSGGESLAQPGTFPVVDAIKAYISTGMPFNGEYRNATLVDRLQAVPGVVIPELRVARIGRHADFETVGFADVTARAIPYAGYMKVYDEADIGVTYHAYSTAEASGEI